jgi:hypothetical protein
MTASLDVGDDNDVDDRGGPAGTHYGSDGDESPEEEEDVGALYESDTEEAPQFSGTVLAQAGLRAIEEGGAPKNRFQHFSRIFAGAGLELPDDPVTIMAFRDGGFDLLTEKQRARVNPETPRNVAGAFMEQHVIAARVEGDFVNGSLGPASRTYATLDPAIEVEIVPPRMPAAALAAAGAPREAAIVVLKHTATGKAIASSTVRAFAENPKTARGAAPQPVLVIPAPLVKWAKKK